HCFHSLSFFFQTLRRPPSSTLFPYTDALPILGKVAGTRQLLVQLLQFLGHSQLQLPPLTELLAPWPIATRRFHWHTETEPRWQELASWVLEIYDKIGRAHV